MKNCPICHTAVECGTVAHRECVAGVHTVQTVLAEAERRMTAICDELHIPMDSEFRCGIAMGINVIADLKVECSIPAAPGTVA